MRKLIILFTGTLLLFSCGEEIEKKEGKVVSKIAAGTETEEELKERLAKIRKEEEEKLRKERENQTTLKFDRLKHDFGEVKADTDCITDFIVTNTGDKPLIIQDVKASCGCTTPKKPLKPIAPGESDVIEVKFHSKPGQKNEIKKTVTVTANTPEKIHLLEIRAFVK